MSDSFLRVIPRAPDFVPTSAASAEAQALLRRALSPVAPAKLQVSGQLYDQVQFVDAGENFERVQCPHCAAELDLDWWSSAVGDADDSGFQRLEVILPCCEATTSLNTLAYVLPQGFAKYVLEVTNPGVDSLEPTVTEQLSAILGCAVQLIWARY